MSSDSAYDYILSHLFKGVPLSADELSTATLIPVMHESGIRMTSLGALKAFFDRMTLHQANWKSINQSGVLEVGYSYLVRSNPDGLLIAMPEGIPVNSGCSIHAVGGPVEILGMPTYQISGTDGTLRLADGETVFLLHDDPGHLEIV